MKIFGIFLLVWLCWACHPISQKDDELYSRHLQRRVKLTIANTPIPKDKAMLNLLILNDGQDMEALRVKPILDSLYRQHQIQPLVVVGIWAGDRDREYGIADKPDYLQRGNKAAGYDAFVHEELYPYAKKMSGLRKFHSVAIAGCSLGGLSAFDIAWNHPDKIDLVGCFSASFWWRDKPTEDSSYSDDKNRIAIAKLKASRKKPNLQFWFYAGGAEEMADRDKDSIIDVIDDTKDIIDLIKKKNIVAPDDIHFVENKNGRHDYASWSAVFPDFLIWAFGSSKP